MRKTNNTVKKLKVKSNMLQLSLKRVACESCQVISYEVQARFRKQFYSIQVRKFERNLNQIIKYLKQNMGDQINDQRKEWSNEGDIQELVRIRTEVTVLTVQNVLSRLQAQTSHQFIITCQIFEVFLFLTLQVKLFVLI